ncbi:MAG: hypothetical protein JNM76_13060 [Betaproteobacteria bacterium]|nr:hypothetical protein [Betaproteobacteria bacterium]
MALPHFHDSSAATDHGSLGRNVPKVTAMRCFRPTTPLLRHAVAALLSAGFMAVSPSQAAIPLSGPCDPDFHVGNCTPGTTKDERPAPPAKPAAAAKPAAPAPATPATPAPLKSAPAAKTPADTRPDTATRVSMSAEENCPKIQRAETDENTGPLVAFSAPPLIAP